MRDLKTVYINLSDIPFKIEIILDDGYKKKTELRISIMFPLKSLEMEVRHPVRTDRHKTLNVPLPYPQLSFYPSYENNGVFRRGCVIFLSKG